MTANRSRTTYSPFIRLRRTMAALLCTVMLFSSGLLTVVAFAADNLSHSLTETCVAADGQSYKVTVRYGDNAGFPRGAALSVREITEADTEYTSYLFRTQSAMHMRAGKFGYALFLDISIVDPDDPAIHLQPADGATVDVRIRFSDEAPGNLHVIHFADDEETPQLLDSVEQKGKTLQFETDGFSAYAIVDGPALAEVGGWAIVESIAELQARAQDGLYIGHIDGYYFTNGITNISSSRTGITKTKPALSYPNGTAVPYYFDWIDGTNDQFMMYCLDANNNRQYVQQKSNSLTLGPINKASVFTVEPFPNEPNTFRIRGSGNFFCNMQGGASGKAFAAYNDSTQVDVNNKLQFWYIESVSADPYGLDGQSHGIMSYFGGLTGKGLMADDTSSSTLKAMNLSVLGKLENRDDKIFVTNEEDISVWTFQWAGNDTYYMTSVVDGETYYLRITPSGLSITETPDNSCKIQFIPGTGTHAGQFCLRCGSTTLTYSGNADTGFTIGGSAGSEWLNFVEPADLTADYLMKYSAQKVSVSDTSITNGSKIILYTRVWNDETKRYEFYAVDHDGSLVPCYESGDNIEWIGTRINTLLWNFVEYYWEGTNEPNYYYELYNPYSEKYIAPQVSGGQILSDHTIGINLNGRRNGYYYTPIVAWDDANYSYAGLNTDEDSIESCTLQQTDDFYFAIIQDIPVDDTLHTVDTIDNNMFGITMKMIDFSTKSQSTGAISNEQDRILGDASGGGVLYARTGLLSTDLDKTTGYPTATLTGTSLYNLFNNNSAGNTASLANHLFIQSIYNASGYFEFDSTQNFASLGQNGDFVVYQELGTNDTGSRPSLMHGQFMPYNDIEAGTFSSLNPKNQYTATQNPLPTTDPRNGEQLYLVRQPDYFFGMELEASFIQTPNGHDAWGHDIIYEFTGDDDFWLYVDGELVIDLGGIHSALPGNVNFCTGVVTVNGVTTTLRDIFYNNYLGRDNHTAEEAQAYVDDIFQQNALGQWVFKDYTSHTMRIFYMERGAGASNLHMRFNLASVRPGTVLLSKELSGVENTAAVQAEYPYQIWYKKAEDETDYLLTEDDLNIKVYYKDTITPVTYKQNLTVDGVTYNGVFMLKPGEIAEINLPDDAISYRIVECGINTDVYSDVAVNGTSIEGTPILGHDNRENYGIPYAASKDRSRVIYRNTVDPTALRNLTIEKILYDETGTLELHNDAAIFSFRVYLGTEFEDGLSAANMVNYHVKNQSGEYCVWNVAQQRFDSLGKTDYSTLTDAEKQSATFTTSMNGSISKIPAFYTVEFRELLAGTQFKVEERDYEIPDGYSRQKYILYPQGKGTTGTESTTPAQGEFVANEDPHVDVCNLKGWGLRVNKRWTDADYMQQRDPAYFAVYTGTAENNLTLVPGTLRQMPYSGSTLYWYFQTLPVHVPFEQYEIREVAVTNPTVDADGYVTAYDSISPIAPNGEIVFDGLQRGEQDESDFTYTVLYDRGDLDADSNVRVDTVTNNRPGIVLKKMQWDGTTPLAGATFTLTDSYGNLIGTYTSDEDGLITIAFLSNNATYYLEETKTPGHFLGLQDHVSIRLHDGEVTVTGTDSINYSVIQSAGTTPTVIIKNRLRDFHVVKKDAITGDALAGVHFALHRQVTIGGVVTIDFNPMTGYEDLVTGEGGVLPMIDTTLPAGTYELREKQPLSGYQALDSYIRFSVSRTGDVTLISSPEGVTLTETEDANGDITYILSVPNTGRKPVSVWKTGSGYNTITTGAGFALYDAADFDDENNEPLSGAVPLVVGTTGENGILSLGDLAAGSYRLLETEAPTGYRAAAAAIHITVGDNTVTATYGTDTLEVNVMDDGSGHWVTGQDPDTWQIHVRNYSGVVMPRIGGIGTQWFYLASGILLTAAFVVWRSRRRKGRAACTQ